MLVPKIILMFDVNINSRPDWPIGKITRLLGISQIGGKKENSGFQLFILHVWYGVGSTT